MYVSTGSPGTAKGANTAPKSTIWAAQNRGLASSGCTSRRAVPERRRVRTPRRRAPSGRLKTEGLRVADVRLDGQYRNGEGCEHRAEEHHQGGSKPRACE